MRISFARFPSPLDVPDLYRVCGPIWQDFPRIGYHVSWTGV